MNPRAPSKDGGRSNKGSAMSGGKKKADRAMSSATARLGRFREANQYLGDPKRLNALFEEDGYLFFRVFLRESSV
jgi:hypothetical protein